MDLSLDKIVQENKWIEQELFSPGTVEHSIWVSNAPKRDLITRWAQNLEILHEAGIYKEPVNSISTYISRKLRVAGMESAIHYVRVSLDFKYKNESLMSRLEDNTIESSGDTNYHQNSSTQNVQKLNKDFIHYLERTIHELQKDLNRLEKDVILEPEIPEIEAEQFFLTWKHFINRHREAWDGREKVLSTQQYIMGYCLSAFSLNHAYSKYLLYAKEKLTLTPKQAGKLIRLQVRKIQDVFNPKTIEEALELGFYGQMCDKCGSHRTVKKYHNDLMNNELFCYSEHSKEQGTAWTKLRTIKFNEVSL